ncbi:MAG: hypothetical protein VZR76_02880, partial [Candidatus Enteromonas sp.]|nr:hypothetical protein [Candidatus Enteromonas sp.]
MGFSSRRQRIYRHFLTLFRSDPKLLIKRSVHNLAKRGKGVNANCRKTKIEDDFLKIRRIEKCGLGVLPMVC